MARGSWFRNAEGATAIEYGMIMAGIAVALMAVIFTMGDSLIIIFEKASDKIASVL